ncbi:group I intron-associated PD-(D/E)XK endonuclease [Proteus myxofaciens]|uniref:Uncharacterized protein n=1 Tax=Proteus myxofaciens ATCC 19692 TaxID=1354337 RepID=A0A198G181_9GAMM|nr:hypothetical protein M983_1565 [Proteus myxofaciens ATCC 19692]
MERGNEIFDYSNLIVGQAYTKQNALVAANVAPMIINKEITGITSFKNCIVLFVTLDKRSKEKSQQYNDIFLDNGKKLHWESQNSNTVTKPHMKRILSGEDVILFVRIHEKIKGKTQPFIYIGRLLYIKHEGSKPVKVLYDVVDYQKSPNKALNAIYVWENIDNSNIPSEESKKISSILKKEKSSYQGRVIDVKKKKAIELYAMKRAREDYEKQGFNVIDTSSNCPYDLECHKDNTFRRVEVKGTTTEGSAVYVTSNEVTSANSNEYETDLYILNNIDILLQENKEYTADGGTVRLIKNWKPSAENLEATVYRYYLKK